MTSEPEPYYVCKTSEQVYADALAEAMLLALLEILEQAERRLRRQLAKVNAR